MIKRALISVSNKEGLVPFATQLANLGIEIVSTGGTADRLEERGVPVRGIEQLTGFPEMMDGRLKTLHPKVHGGILALRDDPGHQTAMKEHDIEPIDLVVVNLYPFEATVNNPEATPQDIIENIDIGGPTMVRAAAKNYKYVGIVTDPNDYDLILKEITEHQALNEETRYRLMQKAFAHTAYYDSMIANHMNTTHEFSDQLTFGYTKVAAMRYGENPHQAAAFYKEPFIKETSIANAEVIQGKELSYNNTMDADAALRVAKEFIGQSAAVVIKHGNPCGVAVDADINQAFHKAFAADLQSSFGGIVALTQPCTKEIAEYLATVFIEVVLAPEFEPGVLEVFAKKPNVRVLRVGNITVAKDLWETKQVSGGVLVQQVNRHHVTESDIKVQTDQAPTADQLRDLLFAWKVVKQVKSNAIVLVQDGVTVGIGAGQMSRVDSVRMALWKAGDNAKGCVLASDAFFPFRDSIDAMAPEGIAAIIQPGGSIKDNEVIAAANEHSIPMVFTEHRAFLH